MIIEEITHVMGLNIRSSEQDRYRSKTKQQHQWSGRMSTGSYRTTQERHLSQTGRLGAGIRSGKSTW